MTTSPVWAPLDPAADNLLALVALGPLAPDTADREWCAFVAALEAAADPDGTIRPNALRPLVRDVVAPQRVGAFTRRALLAGLVAYTGEYDVSDDTGSRNAGKPVRRMRWVGAS